MNTIEIRFEFVCVITLCMNRILGVHAILLSSQVSFLSMDVEWQEYKYSTTILIKQEKNSAQMSAHELHSLSHENN